MTEYFRDEESESVRDSRQLELIDRIIGLEAELANARAHDLSRELKRQLQEIHESTTWKIGRAALAPVVAVRRLFRSSDES